MDLPTMSNEQYQIIKNLKENNIIVDSVAGSGKTTTNLFIAKIYSDLNILLLTYNSKLKIETRQKINKYNINNIEVHSYHSFCVKYYDNKCYTDYEIIKLLNKNNEIQNNIQYDIIILDEAQDITPLYYELICKINNDNKLTAKLCLLGDRFQSIYDFNKADQRFIIYADQLFNFNNLFWTRTQLSESFRISYEMSEFINKCMLNSNRIRSNKITNNKPRYIICDTFKEENSIPFMEIKYYLKLGYKPEEIFILAPSVSNNKSPIRKLENLIKTKLDNIPIYVPVSDEEKLDEDILKNKIVFSTFHQAKGLERKVVIVFNFDASYFDYYKRDRNPQFCPNELYVATTRAQEYLTLIHHDKNEYLGFINKKKLANYCNIIGKINNKKNKSKNKNHETSVTQLLKHLPVDILNNCINYLQIIKLKSTDELINIPIKTEQLHGYESVSEITGTAIPAYYEYLRIKKMTIFNEIKKDTKLNIQNIIKNVDFIDSDNDENNSTDDEYINKIYDVNNINLEDIKPDELLYISNQYCSLRSGYLFKLYQINNYNWLNKENLDKCIYRLNNLHISENAKYEHYLELENSAELDNYPELLNRRIVGYIDCIDNNNIYEFKCVNKLDNEHYLQLAIYMYLNENNNIHENIYNYFLYNILTNELVQINCTNKNLKDLMEYLIYSKYYNEKELLDDDFIIKIKLIKTNHY